MNYQQDSQKLVLVGEQGSGKTSLLKDLISAFRIIGLEVAGLLSLGIFEGGKKIAIEVVDLNSDESQILAKLTGDIYTGLRYGDWAFDRGTINWANWRLEAISHTDVFILDEIGPLELEKNAGFMEGLTIMSQEAYQLGIITARPKCIELLVARFPDLQIFHLDDWDKNKLKAHILSLTQRIK